MRQRKSHPPFVVKIEAGYEIELDSDRLAVSVAVLPHWFNRESFLATSAFFVTYPSQFRPDRVHSGSGPRMSILYFVQSIVSFPTSGAVGEGSTRSVAGSAISIIIPTN